MSRTQGSRAPGRGRSAVVALVALALVAASLPAYAHHSPPPAGPVAGSGTLHGTELVEDQRFLGHPCFAATKHIFGLRGEGTYHGRTAEGGEVVYRAELDEGQAMHEGPLHVEVENTAPFHHGPHGTHGSDSGCTTATAGTPVPATFRICSPKPLTYTTIFESREECTAADHVYKVDSGGARVPCTGTGSFVRKGLWGQENWHADWTLDADCVVVGNDAGTPGEGVAPRGTAHTHRGIHAPCGGTCVDNFKVDYVQHLPAPGLAVSVGGPAGAPIGQTVTLTAAVTDDGAPLTGAPVAFTVAGPGPGAPPAATVPTGADGRAAFTFTAAVEGDYEVTASTTWPTYPGEVATDTHSVRFTAPAPRMTLGGLARAATEDPVSVTATIVDENNPVPGDPEHDPVPGVPVEFTVTGAGQATPASETAVTDLQGRATFTFAGDRAGDYTVTASATYAGQDMTATHLVRLDVKTLSRVGAIDFPDAGPFDAAVIDPAGAHAYFASGFGGRDLVKVDLATFERVGTLGIGSSTLSAVIDPAGDYAYFGTNTLPGRVVKVDLHTFERVGTITLAEGEDRLASAVIDPAGDYAYFGTRTSPARVVKVDLATFERVGAVTLAEGEKTLTSAVIDPAGDYAYFGTSSDPGHVVKVDLRTFERVAAITLSRSQGEYSLTSAVIDPAGDYAYFGSNKALIKFDLATFQRVGTIELPDNVRFPTSAVIDSDGDVAYFGAYVHDMTDYFKYEFFPSVGDVVNLVYSAPTADGVLKVDLHDFELTQVLALAEGEEGLTSAVIDPEGTHAYFGTTPFKGSPLHDEDNFPSRVVKTSLTRPPNPALVAGDDAYATDYRTELAVPAPGVLANDADTGAGEPLTAHIDDRPANGRVSLARDGSFTYTPNVGFSGADTFTYVASDGYDYSAPATVTVEVAAPTEDAAEGLAFGYYTDVSLFGGDPEVRGYGQGADAPASAASPAVACPDGGGTASDAEADGVRAVYGPAVIFGGIWPDDNDAAPPSGPLSAGIDCELGSGGHVSASTSVTRMPPGSTWTTPGGAEEPHPGGAGPGPFVADEVHASCTMTPDGAVASDVRIVNGILETSYDESTGEPTEVQDVPESPPVNYTREGTLDHVGDSYRVVFNEQITNRDGSLTVNAVHMYLLGPTATGDMVVGSSTCGPLTVVDQPADGRAVADFDGDGATDLGVFRPSTGRWHIRGVDGLDSVGYGLQGDIPVPGDYDGDGTTDVAVFRPDAGRWYVRGVSDLSSVNYGMDGDIPVPGDYDGDGTTDIAVFRPTTGRWYVRGVESLASVGYGTSGDIPVPGDYDGDGTTDLAVFRPTTGRWYVRGVDGLGSVGYGAEGDIPVPGDYDGDGATDMAVFRPTMGRWHVRGVPDLGSVGHGVEGDIPVPGDYDGDGATDVGVFRPDAGRWYVRGVEGLAAVNYGMDGDIPVVMAPALHPTFFPPPPG